MFRHRFTQLAVATGVALLPWVALNAPVAAAKPQKPAVAGDSGAKMKAGRSKGKAGQLQAAPLASKERGKNDPLTSRTGPAIAATAPVISSAHAENPLEVAARVDTVILAEITSSRAAAAPRCNDADFLRRVSFDIAGVSPSPQDVTLFGLDPDPKKRERVVDRLLESSEYAVNWSRYWRDVIFMRATETRARLAQRAFESWMTDQLHANKPWHEIVTALLTATGDVSEVGQTALVYSQRGEPDEVAAETARIFLGIQIQCANCHDHPTDSWKRDQFHGLAAFFPRIQVIPKRDSMMRSFEVVSLNEGENARGGFENLQQNADRLIARLDKNRDKRLSREEIRNGQKNAKRLELLFDQGDANKDGQLTAAEIRIVPPPPPRPGRGSAEYYMPDLNDPQSQGTKFDPAFFLGNQKPGTGLSDRDRRQSLAYYITSPDNPWFSRALVNRVWAQLVGEGFYMPIDDIGPERTARHPDALEALSAGFTASGYNLHWLFRAIANTETYQRQIRHRDPRQEIPAFASATPSRLSADQLYDSLTRVMGIEELGRPQGPRAKGMQRYGGSPRDAFHQVFSYDPSTAPDEINGTLPQALLLMNSPQVNNQLRARGATPLAELLTKFPRDDDALKELILLVHAREPSSKELKICHDYIKQVGNRHEAYEDLLWSLVNSTEFHTKR